MANHGLLYKKGYKVKKKTSSNKPCGRDSEYIIGAYLKSFSIYCIKLNYNIQPIAVIELVERYLDWGLRGC